MTRLKRTTKYVLIIAAAVVALLPANAPRANASPTVQPPIVTPAQCRAYGFVHTFVTGSIAKGKHVTKLCLAKVAKVKFEQALPDSKIPVTLRRIRGCESHGDPNARPDYLADNASPESDASGAYQYLDSTWQDGAAGAEVKYARAKDAPPGVQDRRALRNYNDYLQGESDPWRESAGCWS